MGQLRENWAGCYGVEVWKQEMPRGVRVARDLVMVEESIQSLAQAGKMLTGEEQSSRISVPWAVQQGNCSQRLTGPVAERKQLKVRWPVRQQR